MYKNEGSTIPNVRQEYKKDYDALVQLARQLTREEYDDCTVSDARYELLMIEREGGSIDLHFNWNLVIDNHLENLAEIEARGLKAKQWWNNL